jgi:hypothetical protein
VEDDMSGSQQTSTRRGQWHRAWAGAALVLLTGVGLAAFWSGAGADASDNAHTARQVQQIERQRLAALVDVDVEVIERLHASDFELVPPPGFPLSREEYLGLVESGALDYREFEPVSDIEVRVHGSSATVWYRSSLDVEAAGQGRVIHEAWHLYLYEKRSGQWQVVREQATAVGGFPPGA